MKTPIQDIKMKLELGNTLIDLCKTVPSGVVVFFTSYKQEAAFYDLWQKNGLLQKLEAQKTIFREPKKTSDVDELLEKYGRSVRTRGAILFAVVGGKVSEGINFTGELCRAVIMIGLPFPDIKSVELRKVFISVHLMLRFKGVRESYHWRVQTCGARE